MGRRDHLVRIALQANQSQILEAVTPTGSDDGIDDDLAVVSKNEKIQQFDVAQGAVLQAIGFMSDEARKKDIDTRDKERFNISSACQVVEYILPFPFVCQRNQIQVRPGRSLLTVDIPVPQPIISVAVSRELESCRMVAAVDWQSL